MMKVCWSTIVFIGLLMASSFASHAQCENGKAVTIPSQDGTDPGIAFQFELESGQVVTVTRSTMPYAIRAPSGSNMQLTAISRDPQGVQDVQLWIGTRNCSTDLATNITSCSGPGLLAAPIASNPDLGQPGGTGCSARVVQQTLSPIADDQRSTSYEVRATGKNFGGGESSLGIVRLLGVKVNSPPPPSPECPNGKRCCEHRANGTCHLCWPVNRPCP